MSAANVLDAAIISLVITTSRQAEDENSTLSKDEATEFCRAGMRLIGRIVSLHRNKEVSSLDDRLKLLAQFYQSEHYLSIIVEFILSLLNFNDFLHFMEITLKELFDSGEAGENALAGPTKITETSVLGILIRTLQAQWAVLDFAQQCALYRSYTSLVSTLSVDSIQAASLTVSEAISSPQSTLSSTPDIVEQIESSCQDHDVNRAEFLIHQLFDSSSSDPLRRNVRKEFQSLQVFVQDLDQSFSSQGRLRTNQSAMITLAILWLRAGNLERAYIAVEEALKTAHHSGDHPSVVRCLLVLFHVFQHDNNLVDCEDIIMRCLVRAGALKMHEAVAEAALILATLKLQMLPSSVASSGSHEPKPSSESLSTKARDRPVSWSFRNVLNILLYAAHGETSSTVKFCLTKETVSVEDVGSNLSPMNAAQQAAAGKSWPVAEELPKNDSTFANFSLRCASVQAQLWMKAGNAEMAGFVTSRALNLYHHNAHREVVVVALLQKLLTSIEATLTQEKTNPIETFVALLRRYRKVQDLMQANAENSKFVTCLLNMAIDVLGFFCAVSMHQWTRAERFSEKIVTNATSLPLSQFSLPLLDTINHHRFRLWRQITVERCKGNYEPDSLLNRILQHGQIGESFAYLVRERTVHYLLHSS